MLKNNEFLHHIIFVVIMIIIPQYNFSNQKDKKDVHKYSIYCKLYNELFPGQ